MEYLVEVIDSLSIVASVSHFSYDELPSSVRRRMDRNYGPKIVHSHDSVLSFIFFIFIRHLFLVPSGLAAL